MTSARSALFLVSAHFQRGWGGLPMRYSSSEKAEIIQLVEQSDLPAKHTLDKLGTCHTGAVRVAPRCWVTTVRDRIESGTGSRRTCAARSSLQRAHHS